MLMLKIRFASAALLLASSYAACPSSPTPPAPTSDQTYSDSGAPASDCAPSCAEWQRLKCPEGNPSPGGVSCVDVCLNASDAGIDTAKQLGCARASDNCDAMRACPY